MKIHLITYAMVAALSFGAAQSADAALLSIDFNSGSSQTEAGFTGQNSTDVTHSTTEGDVQVEVIGAQGNFNDNDATVAAITNNPDFYRDIYFRNGPSFTLRLSGAGINAGEDYTLTFWSFRINDTRATTYVPIDGTLGPATLGPIGTDNTNPTGLVDVRYTATATYTANGSGVLTFSLQGSRPAINGFELSVVPEPSSLALLGMGGLAFTLRRRRK